jgi:parallel beta-helix repeat protein
VRVTNGKISGGGSAIYFASDSDAKYQIDHLVLTDQHYISIVLVAWGTVTGNAVIEDTVIASVYMVYGIQVTSMSGGRFERNTIRGGYYGITLDRSFNNLIADNVVSNTGWIGIQVAMSDRNKIYNNMANGATVGIGFAISGSNNTIDWNSASNHEWGFKIDGSNNIYSNNRALGNSDGGIEAQPGQIDGGGNFP